MSRTDSKGRRCQGEGRETGLLCIRRQAASTTPRPREGQPRTSDERKLSSLEAVAGQRIGRRGKEVTSGRRESERGGRLRLRAWGCSAGFAAGVLRTCSFALFLLWTKRASPLT